MSEPTMLSSRRSPQHATGAEVAPAGVADGDGHPGDRDTIVHLVQWPWDSVAQECTDVLGPAGVDIYVDAVLNHMAGGASQGATGSAASAFTHHTYPAVPYGFDDFHQCGRNGTDDIRGCGPTASTV